MDCGKVQDRFSSLWEKELMPFEEKIIREHLSSCPKCQGEFEQFEKTMQWLRSVEDVEVPEGFFSELNRKMEERRRVIPGERSRGRWFNLPRSFKLPAQAVAMVAIVFLVLYLTKTMPVEEYRPEETQQPSSPLSVQEKPDGKLTHSAAPPGPKLGSKASSISKGEIKRRSGATLSEPWRQGQGVERLSPEEGEGEQRVLETFKEIPHAKDFGQPKVPVPGEGKIEGTYAPQVTREAKKTEAPRPKTKAEIMAYQQMESTGVLREKPPSPTPEKIERELVAQEKALVASKPPQEIVLRISDRKKVIPRLHKLVKQFGGEVVATERDMFLASLPTDSFSEFEKELAGLSFSSEEDSLVAKRQTKGSLGVGQRVKREDADEKSKGPAKLAADMETRMVVRIFLIEE